MERTINDITIFADGLDHPECVVIHPDGSIWAGGEAGQIYRISPDGKEIKEVHNTKGFVLGIAFSPDASWLAICDLKNKCVWRYDISANKLTVLSSGTSTQKMQTPNYAVFDKQGNLYVSDSGTFRQVNGLIYKINTAGETSIWHEGPFSFANGMALSAAQDKLYVVCTWLPGVEAITINVDGTAGERNVVIQIPETCPDGIAIDTAGNLWVSCYAPNSIYKIDTQNQLSLFIHDWEAHTLSNPTNIAFGGNNHQQLFVANLGRWHISRLEMDVPGVKLYVEQINN